jgi:hypothetical protein
VGKVQLLTEPGTEGLRRNCGVSCAHACLKRDSLSPQPTNEHTIHSYAHRCTHTHVHACIHGCHAHACIHTCAPLQEPRHSQTGR